MLAVGGGSVALMAPEAVTPGTDESAGSCGRWVRSAASLALALVVGGSVARLSWT